MTDRPDVTDKPSISVVIPMFNAAQWVGEALACVAKQTYPVMECIVVDDGSTDGSTEIVRQFAGLSTMSTRLVRSDGRGPSAARNKGVAESSGGLIAFLDADDVWNRRKLELQVALMVRTDAAVCFCGYEIFDSGSGHTTGVVVVRDVDRALRRWVAMEGHGFGLGSTAVFRADFLNLTTGFDHDLLTGEDLALVWGANRSGRLVMEENVLVGYRFHGAQLHADVGVTAHNMRKVYDIVFDDGHDPGFERRCRANLDAHAGFNLILSGRVRCGIGCLGRSFRRDPRRVVTLPLHALGRKLGRWVRKIVITGRSVD